MPAPHGSDVPKTTRNVHDTHYATWLGRLSHFREACYSAYERSLADTPFTFIGANAYLQDHDAILQHTQRALSDFRDADAMYVAAALVLLNDMRPLPTRLIMDAFDTDLASFAIQCLPPEETGTNALQHYEAMLHFLANASNKVQNVHLALRLGQVQYSPEAVGLLPYWRVEAETMDQGEPLLRQRVLEAIDTASATKT